MRRVSGSGTTAALIAVAVGAAAALGTATTAAAAEPAVSSSASASATAAPAAPAEGNCPQTAAKELGWGEPSRHSDFDGAGVPPDWHPYGPEPGHAKKGTRTPDAVTVGGGIMSINGSQDGVTGAVSWHPGQQYGRWEACVRADEGSGGLNALLLLWPVAEDFPVGGEIDWMENMSADRQKTNFFLHYGAKNQQTVGAVQHDATEWSAWALEWTPEKITGYVNGKEWYSSTETSHFPPRPMNMTMQLDYFPPAGGPSAMHMDWADQWALPESKPATLSLPPGAAATGQPRDYPDRKPRPVDGPAEPGEPGEPGDRAGGSGQDDGDRSGSGVSGSDDEGTAEPSGTSSSGDPGTGVRPRQLHPEASAGPATGTPHSETGPPGDRARLLHPSG